MKLLHRRPLLIAIALVAAIMVATVFSRFRGPARAGEIGVDFVSYNLASSLPSEFSGGPFPAGQRVALFGISNKTELLLRRLDPVIERSTPAGWVRSAERPTLLELRGNEWFNLPPRCFTYLRVLEPPGAGAWRVRFAFTDIRNVDGPGWRGILRRIPIYRLLHKAEGVSAAVTR